EEEAAEIVLLPQRQRQEELQRGIDVGFAEGDGGAAQKIGGRRRGVFGCVERRAGAGDRFPEPCGRLFEARREQPRRRRLAERSCERFDRRALLEAAVRTLLEG